ncbi:ThiF family adenylyltransferase [Mesorhizobium escarrei]|uniref:ThiF domain-containing protein n=1 Tax=Mesorhizobium escarrei TaxID=666018 RepID=A0ABM9E386_9HYPH|nr:ThiF family adenylyltransferase [Mesorhizobium escarrei]CAH2403065.1 ThiF domain-containing protein [Mesorhizobium escarrei]
MLIELASHNDDIRRLLEKGYALRIDTLHLVVRDIPYLDHEGALQTGSIVSKLVPVDQNRYVQHDHQVFFAGSAPYGLDGCPVANLSGGEMTIPLSHDDVTVQRSFSNKPPNGFPDFFDKIEHYVAMISGPAFERYPQATPLTFRVDPDILPDSVFKVHDSLTSRAEIADLASVFKDDVIAIIGLGGTGSYVLDFMAKTRVKEIRGFDGDKFYPHNAFRSPGVLDLGDWGKSKAATAEKRYANFRYGLSMKPTYIDASSSSELEGVTFAFVCVDKGSARAAIFDLLIALAIPFIDVGMGLNRKQGPLAGTLRATYFGAEKAGEVRAMNLAETVDDPDNVYRENIQIAELNALNASLAVMRYKQLRGFYVDDNSAYHLLMDTTTLRVMSERDA